MHVLHAVCMLRQAKLWCLSANVCAGWMLMWLCRLDADVAVLAALISNSRRLFSITR